jgi:hypothetical protein
LYSTVDTVQNPRLRDFILYRFVRSVMEVFLKTHLQSLHGLSACSLDLPIFSACYLGRDQFAISKESTQKQVVQFFSPNSNPFQPIL